MKKKLFAGIVLILIILVTSVIFLLGYLKKTNTFSPLIKPFFEKPLDKYTIENLQKRGGIPSEITYKDNIFYFKSDGKIVSGVVNKPEKPNGKIVVMLHGSASKEEYYPGFGTEKVAGFLAKNGYVTFAPDFLGYGESDKAPPDDFENRFLTYTTNMDLMASICHAELVSASPNLFGNPAIGGEIPAFAGMTYARRDDNCKLSLWGHSNGGQIALSILAITGKEIPTVLWNPVTKSFPYNILFFTDGYKDEGKWLRGALANFEKDYDVNKYSFDKYLTNIKAPILLQQGEADEWIPVRWNRDFNLKYKTLNLNFKYKEYLGANHNMVPKWNEAVNDTLNFFNKTK